LDNKRSRRKHFGSTISKGDNNEEKTQLWLLVTSARPADSGHDGIRCRTEQQYRGEDLAAAGAMCYDLDLVDVKSGDVIGSAADCLTDINEVGDGVALTGTTFFFFPGGTVVTRGLTTVQPKTHGSADFTHITGAIPQATDDNVIYGDGKFKNASGPVRLSGAVNLSNFPEQATFDCIFVLDIGPGKK
jgi:hypothetical protein